MARKPWTAEEIEFLKKHFPSADWEWLCSSLQRSYASVQIKASRLGVVREDWRWTLEQEEFLHKHCGVMSYAKIAESLGVDSSRVERKAQQLGLRSGLRREWTASDDQILRERLGKVKIGRIEEQLGACRNSLLARARQLGLPYSAGKYHTWSEDEEAFLRANYLSMSFAAMALELGLTKLQVSNRCNRLGLRNPLVETRPEKFVRTILEDFGVKFETGKRAQIKTGIKPGHAWRPDFLLAPNLVIEVNGDYFHCNPFIFPGGPINKMQAHSVIKDKAKRAWLASNGYDLLEIWESECDSIQNVKTKIANFLSSRHELETAC